MYKHLLVPIDGSPLASVTVEQAVRFAREAGARITFLHVQADFASTSHGSLMHSLAPTEFSQRALGQSYAWLARAAAAAGAVKVQCDTVMMISDRTHDVIHEVAHTRGCDLIYMASHGRRGFLSRLASSVTGKLLEMTTLPVLVAQVESNMALTAEQRALVVILDDHRSIAAVIRAMLKVAQDGSEDHETSLKLLRAAVFYLDAFPERQHHPKEEDTLFRVLRMRTPEGEQVLDELERQHRSGTEDLAAIRDALDLFATGSSEGRARFQAVLRGFAESQWKHMDLEENVVLPMAIRHLNVQDWESIATCFETHSNPHADADEEVSFGRVFKRLMDLAANVTVTR